MRSRGTVGRLGLVKMGGAAELSTGGDGRARATGRASTSSHALRLNGATTQANGAGSHGVQAAAAGGAAAQQGGKILAGECLPNGAKFLRLVGLKL